MSNSLTIYAALSFPPFDEQNYSSYTSYIESHCSDSLDYVLMALQLQSYFPRHHFILVNVDL